MAIFNGNEGKQEHKTAYDCLPLKTRIGMNIKAFREMQGLSVTDLADKLHYHPDTVVRAERGERLNPDKIEAIAKALNCNVSFLIPRD